MKAAIAEVERRREIQLAFNKTHGITPTSIQKPIRERLVEKEQAEEEKTVREMLSLTGTDLDTMTPKDKGELKKKLEKSMRQAARDLNFELAASLRDFIAMI